MSNALKIFAGLLIIIALVFTGWYFFSQKKISMPFQPKKSILEQIQEQEELHGFAKETRLLLGKITAIQGNTLTMEAKIPAQNLETPQTPTTRKIIIGEKTKLRGILSIPKGKKDGQTIYATTMVDIKPEDLKVGDAIEVYANEDIKYKEKITPIEIRVP